MIEYYFRLGTTSLYIGRVVTKQVQGVMHFSDRYIGSVWELMSDLQTETPDRFEHACANVDWPTLRRLIPQNESVECPKCADVDMLSTNGTGECPGGMHLCVLSVPVYTCENGHTFFWLGRFVDADDKRVRKILRAYEWDV